MAWREYLVYAGLVLFVAGTSIIFHFNGLYGQDAHEYLRICRELRAVFSDGKEMSHTFFPLMYPLAAFPVMKVTGNDFLALQSVSIIAFIVSFYFMNRTLRLLFPQEKDTLLYLFIFFALSPYALRFGLLSMSDMLSMMCVVVAAYHAVSFYLKSTNHSAVYSLFFSAAATVTRYGVIIISLIMMSFVVHQLYKRRRLKYLLPSMLGCFLLLVPDWLIRHRLLFLSLDRGIHIDYGPAAYVWSPVNYLRSGFLNPDGWQHYGQWNIFYSVFNILHPSFLFAGIFLLFFLRKEDFTGTPQKLFLVIVVVYALFIAGLSYQSKRYLLQTFPFIILLLYPAYARVREWFVLGGIRKYFFVVATSVVQVILFFYSSKTIYEMNRTERQLAILIDKFNPGFVYTFSITPALHSYGISNTADLFQTKLQHVQTPSLLVINEKEISTHFRGMNPMRNVEFIKSNYDLKPVMPPYNGWSFYTIIERSAE